MLCEYEMLSLIENKQHRYSPFDSNIQIRLFVTKREGAGKWIKLQDKNLVNFRLNLYCLVEWDRTTCAEHVFLTGEMRIAFKVLVGNLRRRGYLCVLTMVSERYDWYVATVCTWRLQLTRCRADKLRLWLRSKEIPAGAGFNYKHTCFELYVVECDSDVY